MRPMGHMRLVVPKSHRSHKSYRSYFGGVGMDKLKAIIKREYLTRVRSKGFIIGTILSPLLMSSFILIPLLVGRSAGPDKYHIVALDQSDDALLFESLNLALAPTKPGQTRYELSREAISSQEDLEARRQDLSKRVAD